MSEPTSPTSGLPPAFQILQMLIGKWVSQAIYAAATLGVADHLKDGPRTSQSLADALQVHAPSLYRLLRALASVGLFVEDEHGRFGLTPLGETLRSDVDGSMRAFARIVGNAPAWNGWGQILHSVKTGTSAFEHAYGQTAFEYLSNHPEEAALFGEAMTHFTANVLSPVLAAYDFSRFDDIVDVGGGHGHLLASVLAASPRTRGVLFELPYATEDARQYLAAAGVADRCEVVAGDFFESVPAGGDAYVLKHIIHNWDDERAERILRSCRKAMSETAKLLVIDMVIPRGNDLFWGKFFDLEMLVMLPGGRERTEDEYRALFSRAGFTLDRIVPTQAPITALGPLSIIEAVPSA